ITTRKNAEEALRVSEERLRRIINVDSVGVLIFDESGNLIESNDAFVKTSGYSRAEITSKRLNRGLLTPPEHAAATEQELQKLSETGRIGPYEKEYFRKD